MKLEIFIKTPDTADFVKGGYHYTKKDIMEELEHHAVDEFALGSTAEEVLDFWESLVEDYEIITTIHKARAKDLIKKTFGTISGGIMIR